MEFFADHLIYLLFYSKISILSYLEEVGSAEKSSWWEWWDDITLVSLTNGYSAHKEKLADAIWGISSRGRQIEFAELRKIDEIRQAEIDGRHQAEKDSN